MRILFWPFRTIRLLLAPRWVGRVLFLLAFSSGVAALSLTAAVKFGLLEVATTAPDGDFENELEALEEEASGVSSDFNGEDEDGDADPLAENAEIPESLRADWPEDQLTQSFQNLLGSLESLESILFPPVAEMPQTFSRAEILADVDGRVGNDFKIPAGLRDRTGFWFDIYTKYDSSRRVIHHARYPWIIYKVVDVSFIINSDTPRRLWMRREKADKFVKEETVRVRLALKRLASTRKSSKPTEYDIAVTDALKPLGGDLRKVASRALHEVRVQTGQKNFFREGLSVSSRYLSTMEKIFRAHKMPVELTRIPFVESSFNKYATSKVGASGIWQFMNGTGRKFMLVDHVIDERRSPFKATEAAARLLKENHMILHRSWPLAVTAWNHGPGGIRKAAQRAGSRDLSEIIARYRSRSFDFASSNFYCEFLAALHAETYSAEIFGPVPQAPHVDLQTVKLSRSVRFSDVMKAVGLSLDEFLLINPELAGAAKKNVMLPKGFRLHVPESALEGLERFFAAIATPDVAPKISSPRPRGA